MYAHQHTNKSAHAHVSLKIFSFIDRWSQPCTYRAREHLSMNPSIFNSSGGIKAWWDANEILFYVEVIVAEYLSWNTWSDPPLATHRIQSRLQLSYRNNKYLDRQHTIINNYDIVVFRNDWCKMMCQKNNKKSEIFPDWEGKKFHATS